MSKAEKFIEEHTKKSTNEVGVIDATNSHHYYKWLTPDQARRAVEIAMEETYDKIRHWLLYHINDYVVEGKGRDIDFIFDDIKQAMKDE